MITSWYADGTESPGHVAVAVPFRHNNVVGCAILDPGLKVKEPIVLHGFPCAVQQGEYVYHASEQGIVHVSRSLSVHGKQNFVYSLTTPLDHKCYLSIFRNMVMRQQFSMISPMVGSVHGKKKYIVGVDYSEGNNGCIFVDIDCIDSEVERAAIVTSSSNVSRMMRARKVYFSDIENYNDEGLLQLLSELRALFFHCDAGAIAQCFDDTRVGYDDDCNGEMAGRDALSHLMEWLCDSLGHRRHRDCIVSLRRSLLALPLQHDIAYTAAAGSGRDPIVGCPRSPASGNAAVHNIPLPHLSPQQYVQFARDGYLLLRAAVPQPLIDGAAAEINTMMGDFLIDQVANPSYVRYMCVCSITYTLCCY
jgi:hypothetical protein